MEKELIAGQITFNFYSLTQPTGLPVQVINKLLRWLILFFY